MTQPLNLREIERAATDALAYSKVRSTRTHATNALALVALVREAVPLVQELEMVLYSQFQTLNNPEPAKAATDWLAKVRDEEP